MTDLFRAGPAAIYVGRGPEERIDEALAFLLRLGRDATSLLVFRDEPGADRAALLEAVEGGRLALIVVPEYLDAVSFWQDRPAMATLKAQAVSLVLPFDVAILTPDAATVERLWSADPDAWRPIVEALYLGCLTDRAPQSLLQALMARDPDVFRWGERACDAIDAPMKSAYVSTGGGARAKIVGWLQAGLAELRPAADPVRLAARLDELERRPSADVVERCRALRHEVAAVGGLLASRAAQVHAARCLEEGLWDEAHAAATEAAALAEATDDAPGLALRLQAGALLGKRALAEGLDAVLSAQLLDALFGAAGPVLHTRRFFTGVAEPEATLREVAFLAQVPGRVREWPEALERLARLLDADDAALLAAWLDKNRG